MDILTDLLMSYSANSRENGPLVSFKIMVLSRDSGAKFGIFNSGHVVGHRDNTRYSARTGNFWLAYRSADGAGCLCTLGVAAWIYGFVGPAAYRASREYR